MISRPHDIPSDVSAEEGEVLVDGPNGFAISFTPDAAAETSERLLDKAMEARGQQVQREWDGGGDDVEPGESTSLPDQDS